MGLHGHTQRWGSIKAGLVVCSGDGARGGGEKILGDGGQGGQSVQSAGEAVVSLQRRGRRRSCSLQLEPVGSYQSLFLLFQGPVSLVHGAKFIPSPTHAVCTHRCHTRGKEQICRWDTDSSEFSYTAKIPIQNTCWASKYSFTGVKSVFDIDFSSLLVCSCTVNIMLVILFPLLGLRSLPRVWSSTPTCSLNRAFDLKQGSLLGFISKSRMCPFLFFCYGSRCFPALLSGN